MYAVIRSGGKQYRVVPGQRVRLEKLDGKVGAKVNFEVVAVRTDEGLLTGAAAARVKISGKIVEQGRGSKALVLKYKKTNQYKILRGHRQGYTAVEVGNFHVS